MLCSITRMNADWIYQGNELARFQYCNAGVTLEKFPWGSPEDATSLCSNSRGILRGSAGGSSGDFLQCDNGIRAVHFPPPHWGRGEWVTFLGLRNMWKRGPRNDTASATPERGSSSSILLHVKGGDQAPDRWIGRRNHLDSTRSWAAGENQSPPLAAEKRRKKSHAPHV